MKTLSFRDWRVGRNGREYVRLGAGIHWGTGLHVLAAPNGYGKSTLLQSLAGSMPALGGDAYWEPSQRLNPERDVLYLSEYLTFPKWIYPSEWVEFMARSSAPVPRQWIERLRLEALWERPLGQMSQGERRKVTWLCVAASEQPLVLLDEPLDGLDLLAIAEVRRLISEAAKQRVLVLVAHQLAEVIDLATELWVFQEQRLVRASECIADWAKIRDEPDRLGYRTRAALLEHYSRG